VTRVNKNKKKKKTVINKSVRVIYVYSDRVFFFLLFFYVFRLNRRIVHTLWSEVGSRVNKFPFSACGYPCSRRTDLESVRWINYFSIFFCLFSSRTSKTVRGNTNASISVARYDFYTAKHIFAHENADECLWIKNNRLESCVESSRERAYRYVRANLMYE